MARAQAAVYAIGMFVATTAIGQVVYQEDFSAGTAEGWHSRHAKNWSVQQDGRLWAMPAAKGFEGPMIALYKAHKFGDVDVTVTLGNYPVDYSTNVWSGSTYLLVRASPGFWPGSPEEPAASGNAYAFFMPSSCQRPKHGNTRYIIYKYRQGESTKIFEDDHGLPCDGTDPTGVDATYRVVAAGNLISFYINGKLAHSFEDSDPIMKGYVGLMGTTGSQVLATGHHFDNVSVVGWDAPGE